MSLTTPLPILSGERFRVVYRIQGDDENRVRRVARGIALEQTVELPDELVPTGVIADQIVGQIEEVVPADRRSCTRCR